MAKMKDHKTNGCLIDQLITQFIHILGLYNICVK